MIPEAASSLCGVCMLSPYLLGFSSSNLNSFHSLKTFMRFYLFDFVASAINSLICSFIFFKSKPEPITIHFQTRTG